MRSNIDNTMAIASRVILLGASVHYARPLLVQFGIYMFIIAHLARWTYQFYKCYLKSDYYRRKYGVSDEFKKKITTEVIEVIQEANEDDE